MRHSFSLDSIWHKKVNISYALLFILIAFATITGWQYLRQKPVNKIPVSQETNCPPPAIVRYNLTEYKYAHPLLVIDIYNHGGEQDNPLSKLQGGINAVIDSKKESGGVSEVSVYIKQFSTGQYLSINNDLRFHPASLSKVPVMMVVLRESERKAGVLDRQLYFSTSENERLQYYPPSDQIKPNAKYTVRELIYRAIVKSDNRADELLTSNMDMELWNDLFTDLELPKPDLSNGDYAMTTAEYSRFMRILYNATYLSSENADYALSLLAKSEFSDGIQKLLPKDVVVAHKFGEFGNNAEPNSEKELHESGIIYIHDNPILLTIMTRGHDMKQLSATVGEIAKYVYEQMNAKKS